MLKNQLKVLKLLFDDLTARPTIRSIALHLKQKYPQTYRTVSELEAARIIKTERVGKSRVVTLKQQYHEEYVIAELERAQHMKKELRLVAEAVRGINKSFVCILFGSQADGTAKKDSDIDLLFVIPEEYDYGQFEQATQNSLTPYDCDISITTEKGLLKMWAHPEQLNIGNEILKKHIIIQGAENFLQLRKYHHTG